MRRSRRAPFHRLPIIAREPVFFPLLVRLGNRWLYHLAKSRANRDNRTRMEYIVPLGILVAFFAWIVATFSRLNHLHHVALSAWDQWSRATEQRNERLRAFVELFAGYLPREDVRPRNLRRLADDSHRVISTQQELPAYDAVRHLSHAEKNLRQVVVSAVRTMEDSERMREDSALNELSNQVSLSLFRQDELTRFYNRSVGDYNLALTAPGARLVAGLFGFSPLEEIR